MRKKILFLKKNGKYVEGDEPDVSKYWDKSEFILIPITEYSINGFIPIIPSSLGVNLSQIKHADIDVKLGYLCHEYETNFEDIVSCKKMSFEAKSLTEFINLLHSMDKLTYFNGILYNSYQDNVLINIVVLYMSVTIYDNKRMIYNRAYRYDNTDVCVSNPGRMFKTFGDVYQSYLIAMDIYAFVFDRYDHLWKNDKAVDSEIDRTSIGIKHFEYECFGVYSSNTHTIHILDSNMLNDIVNIYDISFQSFMEYTVDVSEPKDILDFFNYYNYYIINLHLMIIYISEWVNVKISTTNTFYIMDKSYDFDKSLKIEYGYNEIDVNVFADCINKLHTSKDEEENADNEEYYT